VYWGTGFRVKSSTGTTLLTVSNNSISSGVSTVSFTAPTATSSTTTGALVVSGGVGIGSSVNIGGNATINGLLTTLGNAVLHAGNYSSYALPISGGTLSGSLSVTGNITATGNVTAYSDERLKKDWQTLSANFVEQLAQVKSGTYTRTDTGEQQAGSSAQDWQQLLPEVVTISSDEDKTLALAYGNAALVSAVELAKRVVEQDNRIAKLEALVAQLLAK